MPTCDGIHRFLKKRGIPIKEVHVDEDGQGYIIVVKGKAREALEFMGSTAEEVPFTIEEINDSLLGLILWRIRLVVRRCLEKKS